MKALWFVVAIALFFASSANAHVLETSGTIGAVLHVSPDDDPIAGQSSTLVFDFKDTRGHFTPLTCECVVTIRQAEKVIHTQPLFGEHPPAILEPTSIHVTFPTKDIYEINISGRPIADATFEPFELTYHVRVARTAPPATPRLSFDHLHLAAVLLGAVIVSVGILKSKSTA